MLCRKPRFFYAEGVAQHSPGSRQRTLGEKRDTVRLPRRGCTEPIRPLVQPLRGRLWGAPLFSQGALARPWEKNATRFVYPEGVAQSQFGPLCNPFGVGCGGAT